MRRDFSELPRHFRPYLGSNSTGTPLPRHFRPLRGSNWPASPPTQTLPSVFRTKRKRDVRPPERVSGIAVPGSLKTHVRPRLNGPTRCCVGVERISGMSIQHMSVSMTALVTHCPTTNVARTRSCWSATFPRTGSPETERMEAVCRTTRQTATLLSWFPGKGTVRQVVPDRHAFSHGTDMTALFCSDPTGTALALSPLQVPDEMRSPRGPSRVGTANECLPHSKPCRPDRHRGEEKRHEQDHPTLQKPPDRNAARRPSRRRLDPLARLR